MVQQLSRNTVLWRYFLYDQRQGQLRNIDDDNASFHPDNKYTVRLSMYTMI